MVDHACFMLMFEDVGCTYIVSVSESSSGVAVV